MSIIAQSGGVAKSYMDELAFEGVHFNKVTSIGNKLAGVLAGFWEKIPLLGIFSINLVAALLAALAAGAIAIGSRR